MTAANSGIEPAQSDIDLHTDEVLIDPYPLYNELRSLGGGVWLQRYEMWAIPRYADVKASLANWEVFLSARRVSQADYGHVGWPRSVALAPLSPSRVEPLPLNAWRDHPPARGGSRA